MNRCTRFAPFALLALAALISTAGCKSNQNAADANQAPPPDSASDPAAANLAPVSAVASAPQSAPAAAPAQASPAPSEPQAAPAPADSGASSDQGSYQQADDANYGEQPAAYAPEPPPAMPEYQQPPDPGDDYLWTPGYWNYASAGYYWVPGVWVQAPYQGALWTPGYWGWTSGRYGFYHGYWGPHIGFYGGVNYGFGYVGVGYQGGYWNSGHFFYNRSVNNINVNIVHNVYNRTVIVNNNVHVSYNGGPGGVQLRPRPAELAALREPHAAPMRAQLENQRAASTNRAQFVSVNHGRPATAAIEKPLAADRDVHPVAAPAPRMQPAAQQHGSMAARPQAQPAVRPEARPQAQPAPRPEARPAARPEARPNVPPPARATEPARPQERPAPSRPEAAPRATPHPPATESRPQERPAPHAAPARQEAHPAPARPAPREPAKQEAPKHEEHPG